MSTSGMSTSAPAAAPGPAPDRRARNRARTRRALIDAAMPLFIDEGFSAVGAERIADAAGVSPRTFFRYFPTKEDVVFADYEDEFDVWDQITSSPRPGETLLDTIRRGTAQVAADYEADPQRWDRWSALVASEPVLRRRLLESQARLRRRAAEALARLLDLDVDRDPRPTALAAAAMAVSEVASRAWYLDGKPCSRREMLDGALDGLGELGPLLEAEVTRRP